MDAADVVIIGGGVVGCAIARELSATINDIFLLEQLPRLGMLTSTRNSGVVHSGLYYPPGSLKARLCLAGNRLTREFCGAHDVPHRNCGKIIVATDDSQVAELERLAENGRLNGVEGLRLIGPERIRQREPHIAAVAALEVPSAGIVSAEDLTKTYARLAADRGANILTHARVVSLEPTADSITVGVEIGETSRRDLNPTGPDATVGNGAITRERIAARCVINAAGLYADEVATLAGNTSYRIYPVRGEYAEIARAKSELVNALVYPLPHPDQLSLGMHLTRTLWGTVLVGPTARYVSRKDDYESDRLPREEFLRGARPLLPELTISDLQLAYSGLRPKLVPPGGHGIADFIVSRDPQWPALIHLVGIESPGLTAAPAIARYVATMVSETLR